MLIIICPSTNFHITVSFLTYKLLLFLLQHHYSVHGGSVDCQVNYRHQDNHVAAIESSAETGKSNGEMKIHNFAFERIHLVGSSRETHEEELSWSLT